MPTISANDDFIDPRDVLERIAILEQEKEEDEDFYNDDELNLLLTIKSDCEELVDEDLRLVNEDALEEYLRDDTKRRGAVDFDTWPYNHIDWAAASRDVSKDFSTVDFDGVTFYGVP